MFNSVLKSGRGIQLGAALACGLFLPLSSVLVQAAPKNLELKGQFALSDSEFKSELLSAGEAEEITSRNYAVTAYLSSLNAGDGPLAEAAFTGRNASFYATRSNTDLPLLDGSSATLDVMQQSWGFTGSKGNAFFNVELGRSEYGTGGTALESESRSMGFGLYGAESTRVSLRYSEHENLILIPGNIDGDVANWQFNARWLGSSDSSDSSIAVDATIGYLEIDYSNVLVEDEEGLTLSLGTVIYPNGRVGVSLSFAEDLLDNWNREEFNVGVEWFASENLSLSLSYREARIKLSGLSPVDSEQHLLGARLRF